MTIERKALPILIVDNGVGYVGDNGVTYVPLVDAENFAEKTRLEALNAGLRNGISMTLGGISALSGIIYLIFLIINR